MSSVHLSAFHIRLKTKVLSYLASKSGIARNGKMKTTCLDYTVHIIFMNLLCMPSYMCENERETCACTIEGGQWWWTMYIHVHL